MKGSSLRPSFHGDPDLGNGHKPWQDLSSCIGAIVIGRVTGWWALEQDDEAQLLAELARIKAERAEEAAKAAAEAAAAAQEDVRQEVIRGNPLVRPPPRDGRPCQALPFLPCTASFCHVCWFQAYCRACGIHPDCSCCKLSAEALLVCESCSIYQPCAIVLTSIRLVLTEWLGRLCRCSTAGKSPVSR